MASENGYLRSDSDKSESSPDNDLRLRSDADKTGAPTPTYSGRGIGRGINRGVIR